MAAAVMVAAFHLTWLQESTASVAWAGWIGVQIFFVISGLVIANSSIGVAPSDFLRSRFLRLYPAAWACALLTLVALLAAQSLDLASDFSADYWARFAKSMSLYPIGPWIAGAYWTLPVEMAFYGMVWIVIATVGSDRLTAFATILAILSSCYLVAYSLHMFGFIDAPYLEFDYGPKNMTLLRHGVYFSIGILLWKWRDAGLKASECVTMLLCLGATVLEISCRTVELIAKSPAGLTFSEIWFVPPVLWLAALAVIVATIRWRARIAASPPIWLGLLRSAGLATYPLYLIHEAFGRAVASRMEAMSVTPLLGALAGVAFCVLLAVVIALYIEPQLRRMVAPAIQPQWMFALLRRPSA